MADSLADVIRELAVDVIRLVVVGVLAYIGGVT